MDLHAGHGLLGGKGAASSHGKTPELEDFLRGCSVGWSAEGGNPYLTPKVLAQINEEFKSFPQPKKVSCILSFVNAKDLGHSAETKQAIIDQAIIDPDFWVQGLARLLDGYPKAGTINCAKVDNEFLYRLTEVIDAASATATSSARFACSSSVDGVNALPTAFSQPLPLDAVFVEQTASAQQDVHHHDFHFDGDSMEDMFKEIEENASAELDRAGINQGLAGVSVFLDDTSPQRTAKSYSRKPDFLFTEKPSLQPQTSSRTSDGVNLKSRAAGPVGLSQRPGTARLDTMNNRTARKALQRKDIGLEAARRAAVYPLGVHPGKLEEQNDTPARNLSPRRKREPSPLIQAASPLLREASPVPATAVLSPSPPHTEDHATVCTQAGLPVPQGLPSARKPALDADSRGGVRQERSRSPMC